MANQRERRREASTAVQRPGARRRQDTSASVARRSDAPKRRGASPWPLVVTALLGAGAFGLFAAQEAPDNLGSSPRSSAQTAPQRGVEPPFDYYVLALSWSPAFCRDNPGADQCGDGRRFILHGLWPQFERGWPQDCETTHAPPSADLLRQYANLTGDEDLLAYQWRKHGSCSGLSPAGYLAMAAEARAAVVIPPAFLRLEEDRAVDPRALETAILSVNPDFDRDGVTIRCPDNAFTEVRICLTVELEPRVCGRDVVRDCAARAVDLRAPR